MTVKELFQKHLEIKESYELPDRLMKVLMDPDEKERLMDVFSEAGFANSVDIMNDYFMSEHSDRKSLMQDFTPSSITELIRMILPQGGNIADICAGVGGLSLNMDYKEIYCHELSKRALPLLLFSLAIANRKATVVNGDVLTDRSENIYRLEPGEKYSTIEIIEEFTPEKYDLVISNPPYSAEWRPNDLKNDPRFSTMPLAPKSKADYAFLISSLGLMGEQGTMAFILPHGVLFRGSTEEAIREELIKRNLLDAVIGLPEKMFTSTDIPTVLMILKNNRERKDILFITAEKTCEIVNKRNVFTEEHLEKIVATYKHRMAVEKFSKVVELKEIEENGYNLNIPRYVDTFEDEPVPDLIETLTALFEINKDCMAKEIEFFNMIFELTGTNEQSKKEIEQAQELVRRYLDETYGDSGYRKSEKREDIPEGNDTDTDISDQRADQATDEGPEHGQQICWDIA